MIEFKYDEIKKQGWFTEVNPRFWGSVGLAINAGVNFPYLLFQMAIDGDVEPVLSYKEGLKAKWLLGDISVVAKNIFSDKTLSEFKKLLNEADIYDDYYKDDKLPFYAWIYLLFRRKLVKLK